MGEQQTPGVMLCWGGGPKISSFYWDLWTWGWSVLENWIINFQRLGYSSSTPLSCQVEQFLTVDGQIGAVIFHRGLWVSKTLLHVTSHPFNVSSPGCDSLSTPPSLYHFLLKKCGSLYSYQE
jgi:hypothetical protein